MIPPKVKELGKKVVGHVYIFGMLCGYVTTSWVKKKGEQLTNLVRKPFR